ncbi:winged helix DNA-binding domain-containing protein [Promicromonospora iranensis]|uniref:winged helix DNA-binding domain-containing protein n=1 Tax=Promicromonospora iranensis TaxID=1105144 RepID=UPI0023A9B13E|nr:winged helix DNA-binding domain-containing protein [Promicromonospora iranensis]
MAQGRPVTVSRGDVVAFRLGAHHLVERQRTDALLDVAGRCAVQDSPPGSALQALRARVRDVTPELADRAVAEQKSLLQTWSMRGAPYWFPTADAAVFTAGVLPTSEGARRHLVLGVEQALETLGLSLSEAVELTRAEIRGVLSGRRLAINELGAELARRVADALPAARREAWRSEGPYAANQPLGEGVVHFCLRILTLEGVVCFAPRAGNKAPFVLVDEWLGHPLPETDPEAARAELLHRYLRCYGPSTRKDFAAWLGVAASDVDPWWRLVEDDLTEVDLDGPAWLRSADLDTLRSSAMPTGVRLLPPRDPYTQLRDRETLVDRKYHREVWKTAGDPGTVLVDGEIAGTWRPRKKGHGLILTVTTFRPLPAGRKKLVRDEAEQLAPLRGASSVTVELADH